MEYRSLDGRIQDSDADGNGEQWEWTVFRRGGPPGGWALPGNGHRKWIGCPNSRGRSPSGPLRLRMRILLAIVRPVWYALPCPQGISSCGGRRLKPTGPPPIHFASAKSSADGNLGNLRIQRRLVGLRSMAHPLCVLNPGTPRAPVRDVEGSAFSFAQTSLRGVPRPAKNTTAHPPKKKSDKTRVRTPIDATV